MENGTNEKSAKERLAETRHAWYLANREKHKARHKVWRQAHPDKMRAYEKKYKTVHREKFLARIKKWRSAYNEKNRERINTLSKESAFRCRLREFGLTEESHEALLASQGGTCAICKRPERHKSHSRLAIDHDHKTGKVRGLLCHGCNVSIGHMEDRIEWLRSAISYLEG